MAFDPISAIASPLIGGAVSSFFGSDDKGGGGGNTGTTTNAPWEPIQPYLIGQYGLYPEAQQIYKTNQGSFSPQSLAAVDPATRYGYGMALQNAMNLGDLGAGYLDQVAGQFPALGEAMNFGLTRSLDISNNPAVQAQIEALNQFSQSQRDSLANQTKQRAEQLTTDYTRAFNEQTLPQLRGGAIGAGQFGSSRDDIATGLAQSRSGQELTRNLANLSQRQLDADKELQAQQQGQVASLMGNAYNTGAGMFNNAMSVTPRTIGSFTEMGQGLLGQGPAALQAIGQFNQGYEQQQLDQPWNRLKNYSNIFSGAGSMGGTTTNTAGSTYSNPLGAALGLGAAGYGIYDYGKKNNWWGGGGAGSASGNGSVQGNPDYYYDL